MSEAAVGSVSHILKTAFKEIYEVPVHTDSSVPQQSDNVDDAVASRIPPDGSSESETTALSVESLNELILPHLATSMKERKRLIDSDLQTSSLQSSDLSKYMRDEKMEAYLLETTEIDTLKQKGVVVGQHIPSLPSKLSISPERLHKYAGLSENLGVARNVLEDSLNDNLKRRGNKPISDLAETIKYDRAKKVAAKPKGIPGYAVFNKSFDKRSQLIHDRFASLNDIRHQELMEKKNYAAKNKNLSAQKKDKYSKNELSVEDILKNDVIIKRMEHKMNYLKNPKNESKSITNTLITDDTSYIRDDILFQPIPEKVLFKDFSPGHPMTTKIHLRNISTISRSIRIVPPQNSVLTIVDITYPPFSKAGMCAPGMSIIVTLKFCPISITAIEDIITIETEGGDAKIPIYAYQEGPRLTMSTIINVGSVLVGDANRLKVRCQNEGGKSKFKLMIPRNKNEIPSNFHNVEVSTLNNIRMTPFTIYPVVFSLNKNEDIDLIIEFVPMNIGKFQQIFWIIAESMQIFEYTLVGISSEICVNVIEVNDCIVDASKRKDSLQQILYFDPKDNKEPTTSSEEQCQNFVIANESGLSVEYEWIFPEDAITKGSMVEGEDIQIKKDTNYENNLPDTDIIRNDNTLNLQNMTTEFQSSIDYNENRIVRNGISISPAKGTFGVDGLQKFIVTYASNDTSSLLPLFELNASMNSDLKSSPILLLKNVPDAAIPNPAQRKHLERLSTDGHGKFYRLKSWIEEIGLDHRIIPASIVDNVGSTINSSSLLDLYTLFHFVLNYVKISSHVSEIASRMSLLLEKIKFLFEVDEEDGNLSGGDDLPMEEDASYGILQEGEDNDYTTSDIKLEMFTSESFIKAIAKKIIPEEIADTEQQLTITKSGHMFLLGDEEIEERMNQITMKSNNCDDNNSNDDDDEEEKVSMIEKDKSYYSNMFLNSSDILKLMGINICKILDTQIMHEAVHFIKKNSLKAIPYLHTIISGKSLDGFVQVSQPLIHLGHSLTREKTWNGKVHLTNTSDTLQEIEFMIDELSTVSLDNNLITLADDNNVNKKIQIEIEPPRILMMPNLSTTIDVSMTVFVEGLREVRIPCSCSSMAKVDDLRFLFEAMGPIIRFLDKEIDLGLVGVEEKVEKISTIVNEGNSDVNLDFSLLGVDIDTEVTNSNDNLLKEMKNASLFIEPCKLILKPNEVGQIKVCCIGGQLPQRVRQAIKCKIDSSMKEVDSMPDQFIGIRCEVQSPKIIMKPTSVTFDSVYIGIPTRFTITLSNICNLPAAYRFEVPYENASKFQFTINYAEGWIKSKEVIHIEVALKVFQPGQFEEIIANHISGSLHPVGITIRGNAIAPNVSAHYLGDIEANPQQSAGILSVISESLLNLKNEAMVDPVDTQRRIQPIDFSNSVDLYTRNRRSIALCNMSPLPLKFIYNVRKYSVVVVDGNEMTPVKAMEESYDVKENRSNDHQNASSAKNKTSMEGRASTSGAKSSGTLIPHEDGKYKFKSVKGQLYGEENVLRFQDREFLASGLGASYLVESENNSLTLNPWSVVTISITSFNDMSGCYNDDISILFSDCINLGWTSTIQIPIHMTVVGCPVKIADSTYGLTSITKGALIEDNDDDDENNKGSENQTSRHQLLSFGCASIMSEKINRELTIINNGSIPAEITWKIRQITDEKINGPLKVSLDVMSNQENANNIYSDDASLDVDEDAIGAYNNDDGNREKNTVRTVFQFWSDLLKESPYEITPSNALILPYGRMKFKCTISSFDRAELVQANLIGLVKCRSPLTGDEKAVSNDTTTIQNSGSHLDLNAEQQQTTSVVTNGTLIPNKSDTDSNYRLEVMLRTKFIYPSIIIGNKTFICDAEATQNFSNEEGLQFECSASSLGERNSRNKSSIDPINKNDDFRIDHLPQTCIKEFQVVNPTDATLVFRIRSTGPFILSKKTIAFDNKDQIERIGNNSTITLEKNRNAETTDEYVELISLTPNSSRSFILIYSPGNEIRNTIHHKKNVSESENAIEKGNLYVNFSTGQSISLPLQGIIKTPLITCSTSQVDFGTCRVGIQVEALILLFNPTTDIAKWRVEHIPRRSSNSSGNLKRSIEVPGYTPLIEGIDDPNAFSFNPSSGNVDGPTVSENTSISAPAKDYNRNNDDNINTSIQSRKHDSPMSSINIVPQRLSETSWASSTLNLHDSVIRRKSTNAGFQADAKFPYPIKIAFKPLKNELYKSCFRFSCENGNYFDIKIFGKGTFEEHLHAPFYPTPGNAFSKTAT
jgi:hypothetical protein